MKAFNISSLLLAAFAVTKVSAQYYANQSALFSLVLISDNCTINGSALGACHEGAAIEGLCVAGPPSANFSSDYTTFQFNTSQYDNTTGELTYTLHGGNFNVSSSMSLVYSPASNVAVPEFTPGDEYNTLVAFDADGKMNIQGYLDDTVYPEVYNQTAFYRWWVCQTDIGYQYQTLAWVLGNGQPENPTCVKVDVVRVFG